MSKSTADPGPVDEGRRREFESAWTGGRPPPIEDFLPPEDSPMYLGTLEELVHLELEFAWKQVGTRAGTEDANSDVTKAATRRVQDYLQRFPQLDQPDIVARLQEQEQEVRRRYAGGEPTTTFTPGMRLGRYQLIAEHARGGYGSVWRATDTRLGREIALKQLRGGLARHADFRQRFVHEARVTARLEHPGIVPVYDVANLDDDPTFYAMKLVRGKTLAEAIEQTHALPATSGARTVEQQRLLNAFLVICQSMEYAHARGVLHRDLKPQNIVLSDYGETVILDWGLAKGLATAAESADGHAAGHAADHAADHAVDIDDQLTRVGTVKGTPAYMSPEQAAGLVAEVDEQSDVYALGVILYQVLTGRVPFAAPSSEELLARVIEGRSQPPRSLDSNIHPALEAVCLRAMATARRERYAAVADLTRDLQQYLADEPVSAFQEPARIRLGRWIRRHRALVTGLGAALVVAVISLAAIASVLAASNEQLPQAKEHAEANLGIAKDAVRKYFTTVSESPRLKSAGLVSLRRELLADATDFYRMLTEQESDEPDTRRERGHAFLQLAQITVDTDSIGAAVAPCRDAQRIFRKLIREYPEESKYVEDLAESHRILGVLYQGQGHFEPARSELERALSVFGDADERLVVALIQSDLGDLCSAMNQLEEAEEHLLASLRTCQSLQQQHPAARRILVLSHISLCRLLHRQGRKKEAEEMCRKGIRLSAALRKQSPDNTAYPNWLGQLHFHLARILKDQERLDEAEQAYLEAARLGRELLDKHLSPTHMSYLATVQGNLGGLYSLRGNRGKARTHFEQAKELWKALRILQPFDTSSAELLADLHRNLGNDYRVNKSYQKALQEFEAAIAIDETLVAASPENTRYVVNLGKSKYIVALVLDGMTDLKGAVARAGEAIQLFEPLLEKAPESARLEAEIRFFFARLVPFRAQRLERLGRFQEAAKDWGRACELADSRSRPRMEYRRALALGRSGDGATAATFAAKLGAGPADLAYEAARLFAIAATAHRQDVALWEQYAAASVQQLERARTAGQLADPARLNALAESQDFEVLKGRPDFRALTQKLQNR
jgi:serine/threonine-protein kinase